MCLAKVSSQWAVDILTTVGLIVSIAPIEFRTRYCAGPKLWGLLSFSRLPWCPETGGSLPECLLSWCQVPTVMVPRDWWFPARVPTVRCHAGCKKDKAIKGDGLVQCTPTLLAHYRQPRPLYLTSPCWPPGPSYSEAWTLLKPRIEKNNYVCNKVNTKTW